MKTAEPGGFLFLGRARSSETRIAPPRKTEHPPGQNLGNPAPLHRHAQKAFKNQHPAIQLPLA
jgi:hypothetical protein